MTIDVEVEVPEGARWCRVQAFCAWHPDQLIAEWSTFDGEHVGITLNDMSRQVFIGGWIPTAEELEEVLRAETSNFGRALIANGRSEAPADEGDQPHLRFHLKCSKPSCSYDAVVREEQNEVIKAHTREMWAAGVAGEKDFGGHRQDRGDRDRCRRWDPDRYGRHHGRGLAVHGAC